MTTELHKRLERRLREWRKLRDTYRLAQHDCEPNECEWCLNKENADMIDRLMAEIREDIAAAGAFKRSPFAPTTTETGSEREARLWRTIDRLETENAQLKFKRSQSEPRSSARS